MEERNRNPNSDVWESPAIDDRQEGLAVGGCQATRLYHEGLSSEETSEVYTPRRRKNTKDLSACRCFTLVIGKIHE